MFRTTHRLRTDVLWFVGYQNSTNFKLASLGIRGAQERALLVSDDNIGTYGSCTIVYMKTTLLIVVLNKYRLVQQHFSLNQYVVYKSTVLNKYRLLYTTNVPVFSM